MIKKINFSVFSISATLVFLFLLWGTISPSQLAAAMQAALQATTTHFGWLYLLGMFGFLLFSLYMAFSRFGTIRLGGEDAEPEFSRSGWFAMLFAAGMGIGLVFWGAAEPVSHLADPPLGLTANTPEAARAALRFSFFHWGLHPWAAYCVVAAALAFMNFNRGKPMLISSTFIPLLGRWAEGRLGKAIDILALIATVFGVATSLGLGALQIGAGLEKVLGVENGLALQMVVIAIATICYLISALSGLDRGILFLSNTNMVLAAVLLALVFIVGPSAFILDALTTTVGDYVNNLVSMSLRMTPFSKREWVAGWTIFYWAWWVAWAPFVGMFIARISYGRTLREFVTGVLLLPTLACFLWFAVFGGTAMHQALFEQVPLIDVNTKDVSMTLFAVFDHLPLGSLCSVAAILLVTIFFVTSADSATYVLGILSSQGNPSPAARVKLVWGTAIALIAAVLLLSGGLKGLQTMSIVSALPFMFLMTLMCFSVHRELSKEHESERKRRLAKEKLLDKILKDYGN